MNKITFLLLIIIGFWFKANSQEVLTPLYSNPKLKYQKEEQLIPLQRGASLNLPILDDFSNREITPNPNLWADKSVYLNNTYSLNMVTIGVATFDGLNSKGFPYDNTSTTTYGSADTLTILPIDLSLNIPSDSIYLSFYYQATGIGNRPEFEDSLFVEFKDVNGKWNNVWRVTGGVQTDTIFRIVLIPIAKTTWLHNSFQFRFRNFASLYGSFDHWHVDYVYVNANRHKADSLFDDVAISRMSKRTFLEYTELPWDHFVASGSGLYNPQLDLNFRNLGLQIKNTGVKWDALLLPSKTILASSGAPFVLNVNPKTQLNFPFANKPISTATADTIDVLYQYSVSTTPDKHRANDTLKLLHSFRNAYAYDDGSAEAGYGLNTLGGQIAMKFKLIKPDSLRAVNFYFTQNGQFVGNELFALRIWKTLKEPGTSNSDVILYEKTFLKPRYTDSINGFYTYMLDTSIYISDSIYIGWIQGTTKILNVGMDLNTTANDKMFYNTTGSWNRVSVIKGCWMIRPVVGKRFSPSVGVPDLGLSANNAYFSFNSGLGELSINFMVFNDNLNNYVDKKVYLYDIYGKLVRESYILNSSLTFTDLSSGIYIISLIDSKGTVFGLNTKVAVY